MSTKSFNDEYKTAWKGKTSKTTKDWGEEIWIGSLHQIHAKVLFLKAGCFTSLKYYSNKNEVLFVRSGAAVIEYSSEEYIRYPGMMELLTTELKSGDVFFVQSGCPYRISAQTDCEIFEMGDNTMSLPVRIEQDLEQG